jgi:hypothetical protein
MLGIVNSRAIRDTNRRLGVLLILSAPMMLAGSAQAHVKWFAPYIVGAAPQPITHTLTDGWFWLGIGLVTLFFTAARGLERSPNGGAALDALDRLTQPLWGRLDDYIRAIVAAFFVAIFSVGGIYLTPDLRTPAEWVSWMQLVIAAMIFWRGTMALAGLGIIALWLLALRDYDLFHMFDYLALGVGVALYLILAASHRENWRVHRFEALRWGLAIGLMWSSLEKFAYPEWFYPLVDDKPFITLGLARDAFIPMAGVAEFTMGFGLIWTPLIRRLSAVALFIIFTVAVWPFGRVEIIGHGLIMAIVLAVAADRSRESHAFPSFKIPVRNIPVGLSAALVMFVSGYWGMHIAFYGRNGFIGPPSAERLTHSHNPEQPHGGKPDDGIGAPPMRLWIPIR